jgi:hypothetical protein
MFDTAMVSMGRRWSLRHRRADEGWTGGRRRQKRPRGVGVGVVLRDTRARFQPKTETWGE